jgi:hypothetical protein
LEFLDLASPFQNYYDEETEEEEEDLDESNETLDTSRLSQNSAAESSSKKVDETSKSEKRVKSESEMEFENRIVHIDLKPPLTSLEQLSSFLISTSSFVIKTCLLFGFLIKVLARGNSNDHPSGQLFLIATLITLICEIYYFPGFKLTTQGYLHLRCVKYVFGILIVAVFLFLLRSCMSFYLSYLLNLKTISKNFPHVKIRTIVRV